jgi:hypothetical protein
MVKKATIPDAWEDDWEAQADKAEQQKVPESDEPTSLTKAERFAKHAETNRKLWESAYASACPTSYPSYRINLR